MYICIICRDRDLPLDDMAHTHSTLLRGICERCWLREVGDQRRLTRENEQAAREAANA